MAAHISKALVSYTVKTIMKSYRRTFFSLILFLLSSVAIPSALAATAKEAAGNQLCDRIEQIQQTQRLSIGGDAISSIHLITEFYDRRNYTLAWQSDRNIGELLAMIEASREEGLLPTDYHQAALKSMLGAYRAGNIAPCDRADLDILLTDALLRLGYHYIFGKVNPRDLNAEWNLQRKIEGRDPVEVMQAAIDAVSLAAFLQKLAPTSPLYDEFKKALAEYRAIEAQGGWPQVAPGPTLKPGMPDERIAVIRERLLVTGDLLDASSSNPTVYDEKLEEAVIRFQKRHVLDVDGVVGKATLAAMNVPVADRIDQIRVNMERARWVYRNLPDEFIVTDIAGFHTAIIKNRKVIWESAVQVGKPYRETPVFQDTMKYIVFNPTWTVPPTILEQDILPKLRKDPEYLRKKNMRVIDSKGKNVDPATIDWANTTRRNFPYMIRQDPGPKNALGRIKFMFPNKHAVYLHDTPHKSGFKRAERTFSSGCIRVEKPFELAEILLNDPDNWSQEDIRKAIESKQTKSVRLKKQIPVYLLYWTVGSRDGMFYFKPDVYSRDGKVLAALNGKFRFDAPDNMPDWYKN